MWHWTWTDALPLRTRGSVSGYVWKPLVAYVEIDGIPCVCAANGGWDRDPAWYGYLHSGGVVEIEYHGRRVVVVAKVLEGVKRQPAFDEVYRAFPHVRLYLARTSRPLPVVRLGPSTSDILNSPTRHGLVSTPMSSGVELSRHSL